MHPHAAVRARHADTRGAAGATWGSPAAGLRLRGQRGTRGRLLEGRLLPPVDGRPNWGTVGQRIRHPIAARPQVLGVGLTVTLEP
jgi:hypothetical protein